MHTDTSQTISDTSSFVRLTAIDTSVAVDAAIRLSDISQEINIYYSIQRAARTHGRHDFYALTQARERSLHSRPSRTPIISILPYVLFFSLSRSTSFYLVHFGLLYSFNTAFIAVDSADFDVETVFNNFTHASFACDLRL